MNNYKNYRTICETCYNKKEEKTKITLPPKTMTTSYQQPKIENVNNNKNRLLIVRFSGCGKSHLLNYILLQKQESIFIIPK